MACGAVLGVEFDLSVHDRQRAQLIEVSGDADAVDRLLEPFTGQRRAMRHGWENPLPFIERLGAWGLLHDWLVECGFKEVDRVWGDFLSLSLLERIGRNR